MDDTRELEAVETWCARTIERYIAVGGEDEAQAVRSIVDTWKADHLRKFGGRIGTLDELWNAKQGVRLAGLLLSAIQEGSPNEMREWRYQLKPANEIQALYRELYRLSLQLGFSIVEIEEEFPQHVAEFEKERREYARLCEEIYQD